MLLSAHVLCFILAWFNNYTQTTGASIGVTCSYQVARSYALLSYVATTSFSFCFVRSKISKWGKMF